MDEFSRYFSPEKSESVLFICVGLKVLLLSGCLVVKLSQPICTGLSYSLIGIALIQLAVGSSIYMRSSQDIVGVSEIMLTKKAKVQDEEISLLKRVMNNFVIYSCMEVVIMIIAITMFLYFQPFTLWRSAVLGLLIQAGLLLLLNVITESRGKIYLEYLQMLK
ncbi:MAG: hypothetical protein JKY52_15155 [Flavobacteriales bacterium]|nr:hypothetical protein [Flavobacteriales bacterium]